MYFIFIEVPKSVLLFNAKHNAPPKGRIPRNIPRNIQETVRITIPRKLHPPVNNVHTGTVPLRPVSQSTDVHVNPQASSDIFRDGGSNKIKSQIRFETGDRNQSMGNRGRNPNHSRRKTNRPMIEDSKDRENEDSSAKQNSLFVLSALGRFKEKHLLLDDGVVLHHAERAVHTRPDHRAVVARHGH
jgi:hypothetical protein